MIRSLVGTIFLAATSCGALAEPQAVCESIAKEANRIGKNLQPGHISELSNSLIAILPPFLRYVEPKATSSAAIRGLLDCASSDECTNRYGDIIGPFLDRDDDPIWKTLFVDTRPWSNEIIFFTRHSGHDRADLLAVLEEQAAQRWVAAPLQFGEADADADDSGFAVLTDGKRPYVVIPPGQHPYDESSDELDLSVLDPTDARATACSVRYHLSARPAIARGYPYLSEMEPGQDRRDAIVAFINEHLAEVMDKTSFDSDLGSRVRTEETFVSDDTSDVELKVIHSALLSETNLADLAERTVRSMAGDYWGEIERSIDRENWEARWLPLGTGSHAYAALLLRFSGPTFMYYGPHLFDPIIVALFSPDSAGKLRPVAEYQVEDAVKFEYAEVSKN